MSSSTNKSNFFDIYLESVVGYIYIYIYILIIIIKYILVAPIHQTKGFTIKNMKEYLDSLETTQTGKLHYSNVSHVAEHPFNPFQIEIVYMSKGWFNHNYKYLLPCIDVFSKKEE